MAKAPVVPLDELKESLIVCEICEEEYDAKVRIPIMLPCLHNFCLVCLEQTWEKDETGLLCPNCRQKWKVEGPLADAFPVDFVSMKIINFLEVKKNICDIKCEDCPEDGKAEYYCKDCQHYLCTICRKYHQRFSKDHQTLTIEQLTPNPVELYQKLDMCSTHKNCKLDFYCRTTQCQKAICTSCTILNHRKEDGHDVQDLHEVWQEKKDETAKLSLRLKQTIEMLQEDIRDQHVDVAESEEEETATIKKVERTFEKIIAEAKRRKDELICSFKAISEKRKSVMKFNISGAESEIQKKKGILRYVDQMVTSSRPVEFLTVADSLQEKCTENSKRVSDTHQKSNIYFDNSGVNDLQKTIQTTGSFIEYRKLFYRHNPVIETFDCVVKKETTILKIFLSRPENLPENFVRKALTVDIEDPKHKITRHAFMKDCKGQPQLQVKFMPLHEGKYTIMLKVDGRHVLQHGFCGLMESGGKSNKCVHLLQSSDDGQTSIFKSIECPVFGFSQGRLNEEQCCITADRSLVRSGLPKVRCHSSFRLTKYLGTLGTMPLVGTGLKFWTVKVSVSMRFLNSPSPVLEIGVADEDVVDTELVDGDSEQSWRIVLKRCSKHNMVCFTDKLKEENQSEHVSVFHCTKGSKVDFFVGFLLDLDTRKMHVIDIQKKSTILVFDNVGVSKPLYPVFGILNFQYDSSIKIIAGTEMSSDLELFIFLRRVINHREK